MLSPRDVSDNCSKGRAQVKAKAIFVGVSTTTSSCSEKKKPRKKRTASTSIHNATEKTAQSQSRKIFGSDAQASYTK